MPSCMGSVEACEFVAAEKSAAQSVFYPGGLDWRREDREQGRRLLEWMAIIQTD